MIQRFLISVQNSEIKLSLKLSSSSLFCFALEPWRNFFVERRRVSKGGVKGSIHGWCLRLLIHFAIKSPEGKLVSSEGEKGIIFDNWRMIRERTLMTFLSHESVSHAQETSDMRETTLTLRNSQDKKTPSLSLKIHETTMLKTVSKWDTSVHICCARVFSTRNSLLLFVPSKQQSQVSLELIFNFWLQIFEKRQEETTSFTIGMMMTIESGLHVSLDEAKKQHLFHTENGIRVAK